MTPSGVNVDGNEALLQTPAVLTYNRSFVEEDSCFGSFLAERVGPDSVHARLKYDKMTDIINCTPLLRS